MDIHNSLLDPIYEVMAGFPVYQVVVGAVVLLAAAGFIILVVPALRRRPALVKAWVLIVGTSLLAGVLWLFWALTQFT